MIAYSCRERENQMNDENGKILLEKVDGHTCFACGTANPIGLQMNFYRQGDRICSDMTLGEYHVGWENIAHGGIISTMLDEVMSWTVLYFKRSFFVTRKMDIKYVRPVPVGKPLTVQGSISGNSYTAGTEKVRVKGRIVDKEGHLLARSTGEFVLLPKEKLEDVPEGMKQEMLALFEKKGTLFTSYTNSREKLAGELGSVRKRGPSVFDELEGERQKVKTKVQG